ncbi:MAG TPA: invasion associated locus B family protein [Micropepsaceae bacterium]|nr:invasion associated locus B family protein [Micropepsaceae bacterium]
MFNSIRIAFAAGLMVLPSLAFAQAPAAAPPPADPAAAAQAQAAAAFSVNQNVGDWVVRCVQTTVKSPAPCEVLQVTVNKDTKQRLSSLSLAYVPSRDSYAMQVVVPTGVALAKGLLLGPSTQGMKYTRCERDGCYVETVVDNTAVQTLGKAGKATDIAVVPYGKSDQIKFPVSLTGFTEAMDRMKSYSKERAVALPPPPAQPGAAPAAAAPARAPAKK